MNIEGNFGRENLNEQLSDVLEVSKKEGVVRYFNFADPILHVDWGKEGAPEEYTPEFIEAHIQT